MKLMTTILIMINW